MNREVPRGVSVLFFILYSFFFKIKAVYQTKAKNSRTTFCLHYSKIIAGVRVLCRTARSILFTKTGARYIASAGVFMFYFLFDLSISSDRTTLPCSLVFFMSMMRWFSEPLKVSEIFLSSSTNLPSTSTSILSSISSVHSI